MFGVYIDGTLIFKTWYWYQYQKLDLIGKDLRQEEESKPMKFNFELNPYYHIGRFHN
jgi:hypothetical protein